MLPQIHADGRGLKYGNSTQGIIGVFYEVYNELGHGFLESVYETSLEIALISAGFNVRHQIEIPVWFRKQKVGDFSVDLPAFIRGLEDHEIYTLFKIQRPRYLVDQSWRFDGCVVGFRSEFWL